MQNIKGFLSEVGRLTAGDMETVSVWLTGTRAESLMRGQDSLFTRPGAYAGMDTGSSRAFAVRDRNGSLLGAGHFWEIGASNYEIGGLLGDEELWSSGAGMEAGVLVLDYLFKVLNAVRVQFTTSAANDQTLRIALADGMRIEAICQSVFSTSHGSLPGIVSSLTRDDYESAPASFVKELLPRVVNSEGVERILRDVQKQIMANLN